MTIGMRTYLDIVLRFKMDEQEFMCKMCGECYQFLKIEGENWEGDIPAVCGGLDASCYDECQKIRDVAEEGYVDAWELADCQPISAGGDSFVGARCGDDERSIEIGVFADEEDFAENADGYGMKMSDHLLNQTFASDGECVASCEVEAAESIPPWEDQDMDHDSFVPGVYGICQELHDAYWREYLPVEAVHTDHQDEHDPYGQDVHVDDGETCVFQTPGGQYYAGRYCEFPATSVCLYDDDDNAGGINTGGTPHFCTNNGTCQMIDRVEHFPNDDFGIGDDGFYCACLPRYYGRYCEMVVPEADVGPPSDDDDVMEVDEYDDDDLVGGAPSPSRRPTEYEANFVAAANYTVGEREALVDFYNNAARGGSWADQGGWLSNAAVCEWYGVACDEGGSATHLELGRNSIDGFFEGSFLARLGNLTVLDLSDNDMYGTISEDVGGLVRLRRLDLGNNNLRGYVPSSLSRLTRLEVLDLSQNGFSAFPMDAFTFATLDKLARVDVSSNMIAGTMPHRLFSSNPDLLHLKMSHNRLMGTIPGAILDTAFEKPFSMEGRSGDPLEYVLDLSFNQLEGRVPNFYAENLTLGVVGNRFSDIDPGACDQDWNDGATKSFGCDGIACPIGTANSEGRQSTEDNPCMNCTSARFLGTVMFEIDEDECEGNEHTGGNPFEQVYRPTPRPVSPPASSYLEVLSPLTLAKEGGYEHLSSLFGPRNFFGRLSVETNVYYADSDLCDPDVDTSIGYPFRDLNEDGIMTPWPRPFILMVDRGECTFVTKVRNAQSVGALAVVIADNTCLCEMLDSCTSDPGQSDCETRWPVIADDGSGSDIYIPSFLMLKQDADLIKAEVRANPGVLMKIAFPERVPSRIAVEYELWMSPVDAASMEFLAAFREYAEALSGYARFIPRLFIYDGVDAGCMEDEIMCYNECTNGGRYCAADPDGDFDSGLSGADVVTESLRWLCIWQEHRTDIFGAQWWEYVSGLPDVSECAGDSFSGEDCVMSAMQKADIDPARIARCMDATGGLEGEAENKLLEEQLNAIQAYGIIEVPTFRVNQSPIDGVFDAANALEAICSGFADGRGPPICRSNEAMTPDLLVSPQQLEAQWFQTIYSDYQMACSNQGDGGLKMCPYDVYCPSGKGADPFRGGPPEVYNNNNWDELEAMQWAPYYNPDHDGSGPALMNWVQIGRLDGNGIGTEDNSSGKCWKYGDLYEGAASEKWEDYNDDYRYCVASMMRLFSLILAPNRQLEMAVYTKAVKKVAEEVHTFLDTVMLVVAAVKIEAGRCTATLAILKVILLCQRSRCAVLGVRFEVCGSRCAVRGVRFEVCGSRQDKYKTSESYRGFEFSVTKRCTCLFDRDELPLISESEYEYVSAVNDGYGAVSGVSSTPGATCYKIIQESTAGTLDGANGGPLTASAPNHTSFDRTDNPSQEPSSQPSNVPLVQTSMPTGGPTEFVDTMASDTNACRKVFPSWKILLLLAPFILW